MLQTGQKLLLKTSRKVREHRICILERAQFDTSTTNLFVPPNSNIFLGGNTVEVGYGSLEVPIIGNRV